MCWPNEERYPDAVEAVRTLLPQVDEDTRLPPRVRTHVQARIAALVPAIPFAPVPPPAAVELGTRLAAFLDIEETRAEESPSSWWWRRGRRGHRVDCRGCMCTH